MGRPSATLFSIIALSLVLTHGSHASSPSSPLVIDLPRTTPATPLVVMGNSTGKDGTRLIADSISFKLNQTRWWE